MISVVLIILAGLANSYASLKSFRGHSVLWPFFAGQITVIVWSYITKQKFSPIVAAVIFDGLYCLSWYGGMLLQGEKISLIQIFGALFVICGIIIVSAGNK